MRQSQVFALILCFLPVPAFAGAISGGGGKAVVCRNADSSVRSAELLDLWEARSIYGREILRSEKSAAELTKEGMLRMKNVMLSDHTLNGESTFYRTFEYMLGSAFLEDSPYYNPHPVRRLRGVALTLTDDSFELARPRDCAVEQVINYVRLGSDKQILINQDLWEALENVNQAALMLHEGLYAYLREFNLEKNSVRTRRAVGLVMAGQSFVNTWDLQAPEHITCASADGETRLHYIQYENDELDRDPIMRKPPGMPSFGLMVEKVGGVHLMGFVGFSGYFNSTWADMRTRFDVATPYDRKFDFSSAAHHASEIDRELEADLELKEVAGGRKLTLTVQSMANGVATPFSADLVCRVVPAR